MIGESCYHISGTDQFKRNLKGLIELIGVARWWEPFGKYAYDRKLRKQDILTFNTGFERETANWMKVG